MRQFQEFLYAVDSIKRQTMMADLAIATAGARADEKGLKKLQNEISPKKVSMNSIPNKFISK